MNRPCPSIHNTSLQPPLVQTHRNAEQLHVVLGTLSLDAAEPNKVPEEGGPHHDGLPTLQYVHGETVRVPGPHHTARQDQVPPEMQTDGAKG